MYLFPLGKRILAIRDVSSGISGNFWGCRDIAFLLLLSTFLLTSYCSSSKYPSFSLSLSIPFANRVLKLRSCCCILIGMCGKSKLLAWGQLKVCKVPSDFIQVWMVHCNHMERVFGCVIFLRWSVPEYHHHFRRQILAVLHDRKSHHFW